MGESFEDKVELGELEKEDLISFQGGEKLTIHDILDAPGEVIGKSSYGTLYKASLERTNSIALLRFLRPACTGKMKEILPVIQMLGVVRHPNLVPLQAFYSGPRGEKLLVHPFYNGGTLDQFVRGEKSEKHSSHEWTVICKISTGIVKAMDYLHTGLKKPVVHGNLKSKNVLLDDNYQPYISDFGLHLLLNPTTAQEMLEASASQGYKAPELIKMRDASVESDIYSLGILLLEILTGRAPINDKPSPGEDPYLPDSLKNIIINQRISDTFRPGIPLTDSNSKKPVKEERLLMFVQLGMACCSPSLYLRPHIKQVLKKIEEISQ
ncbi:Receptor-like protein kinase [Thalictrum thalictroides]|uniref:Receptor-like protein kinase n=1 Tax=Thalictrum thalictroides TaxID=46969 RepID=A0A7J6VNX9_THATH|nr:Receptor-like protein kinase [Thalictrum thalictroides]